MDLEQIEREMLGSELERLFDISLPACKGLTGQSCDQIKTHIRKTRLAQSSKSSQCIRGIVRAAQFCELSVVESLRAEARPVNSQTPKCPQLLGRRASRIYLNGDLWPIRDLKTFMQTRKDALELCRREQRRRAATKINCVNNLTFISRVSDLIKQPTNIALREFALIKTGGEVAIRTQR